MNRKGHFTLIRIPFDCQSRFREMKDELLDIMWCQCYLYLLHADQYRGQFSLCLRGKPWPCSKLDQPGKSLNWPPDQKGVFFFSSIELQENAFFLFPSGHQIVGKNPGEKLKLADSVRYTLINLIKTESQNIINDLEQLDTQLYCAAKTRWLIPTDERGRILGPEKYIMA